MQCCNPDHKIVPCCVCGSDVHTCGTDEIPICPVHPNGSELSTGEWVCSEKCWDIAVERFEEN